MSSTLSSSKRERGLSLEMLQHKRASSSIQGLRGVAAGKLEFLSSFVSTWGTLWCLFRQVRSPLALQGTPRDSSRIAAGISRALSRVEAGTSGLLSISDIDLGFFKKLERGVRPRLVLRHRTPLASRVLH